MKPNLTPNGIHATTAVFRDGGARKRHGFARQKPSGSIFAGVRWFVLPDHPGLAKSLRYLSEHWHKPIGVDDLVKAAAMSRRGFVKAFRKHFGHSPGAELRRVRMDAAKELIARSEFPLTAIPPMCGYPVENSFFVAFKAFAGMSPGCYRKIQKAGSAALLRQATPV